MIKANRQNPADAALLRKRAETKLLNRPPSLSAPQTEADILCLIHELEVQQIELELQNEELFAAKEKAEEALRYCANLRKLEERLQEAESRARHYFENSGTGIVIFDANGTFQLINAKAAKDFNKCPEEMVGRSVFDFFPEETARMYLGQIRSLMESGGHREHEGTFFLSGEHKSFLVVDQCLKDELGNVTGLQCSSIDITEQKKLQHQLFLAQKGQSLGTLAGGIAHRFNNILGIILGYATMLENRLISPELFDECLSAIIKNVERGAELVQQILIYTCKNDVSFELLNPVDVIRETVDMLKQTFPATINFKVDLPGSLPEIFGDSAQARQMLLNLCINARDAMPGGGMISISAHQCSPDEMNHHFSCASGEGYLRIDVSDTGEGMDEATRLYAFDPFFTTKALANGAGLGLSVVEGIIKSHHGFIDLESEKGYGTTVSLFLPVFTQPNTAENQANWAISENRGGTETLLIAPLHSRSCNQLGNSCFSGDCR